MTTTLIDLKTVAREGADLRIRMTGELDLHTAGRVEPRLSELAASGYRNLTLDLSGLAFCDSAGIELFLRVHLRCRATGTRLQLRDVPPLMVKSMRVLGVDRVLRLVVS
ncbi:STAS domain-containing protein [Streptomyces sp. NPDC056224]|uniref:STAS domain-containing protein n=1 Tax=Streptomyces sp. NPDC056224 TaxID=3345750 RepID=UPI0035D9993F